jgi:hypothetical protein
MNIGHKLLEGSESYTKGRETIDIGDVLNFIKLHLIVIQYKHLITVFVLLCISSQDVDLPLFV